MFWIDISIVMQNYWNYIIQLTLQRFVHDFTSTSLLVVCFKNNHQGKQINMKISSTT